MTMYRTLFYAAVVLLLVNATGCKSNNEQASEATTPQPVVVQADGQQPQAQPSAQMAITGKVTETMDASGYTYVNVETEGGPVWAAIPQTTVEVGQEVALAGGMAMENFESKSLGRTFESVIFSSGMIPAPSENAAVPGGTGGESFDSAMQGEASQAGVPSLATSGGSEAAMAQSEEVVVEKAEGENAYTVGEIFEKKSDLDKQKVIVRGKVVKVSSGIMGKNWLHLQDGTGDAATKTHDLVVTTAGTAEKGTVVIVEGIVAADRDFGSGYRYDAIIEEAEVK